jgi:hypothetical protein
VAKPPQPKTLEEAVLLLQDRVGFEESARVIGTIISEQFPRQLFWQRLPEPFATTPRLETYGRTLGPWLVAVSTGECEWAGVYDFNYRSRLRNYPEYGSSGKKQGDERIAFSDQPNHSFLAKVDNLPPPLMREFQADPRILATIVTKGVRSVMGHARPTRTDTAALTALVKTMRMDLGLEATASEVLDWLGDDRNFLNRDIAGICDIEFDDKDGVTFHREGNKPIKRKFKTFYSNHYRKINKSISS